MLTVGAAGGAADAATVGGAAMELLGALLVLLLLLFVVMAANEGVVVGACVVIVVVVPPPETVDCGCPLFTGVAGVAVVGGFYTQTLVSQTYFTNLKIHSLIFTEYHHLQRQ